MTRLKLVLALCGLGLAMTGIALESRPLVWLAIALLASSLGVSWYLRRLRQRD
jgi:Flp pilus assembly protein TadB